MRRRLLVAGAGCALLVLAGCGERAGEGGDGSGAGAAGANASPVSIDTIAAQAQGFNLGSTMSARTAYVFFDAQCPHCAALWLAARPLRSQIRFVWIPVGILNEKSTLQGAALLAAADPVAAMDQHEASMREQRGGITAAGDTGPQQDAVKRNTALMTRFAFASVPTVVARHAQTNDVVTIEGSVPTPVLAQRLGLQAP